MEFGAANLGDRAASAVDRASRKAVSRLIVVGGIVFRVVTPNYPGDPQLDGAGAIRTEYLADDSDPLGGEGKWTLSRDTAHIFEDYENGCAVARKIGSHCHVSTVRPKPDQVPEELTPQFTDIDEKPPVRRKKKQPRSDFQMDAFRVAQCRRDPVEIL